MAIDPESTLILAQNKTQERNLFGAEMFMHKLVKGYGKQAVSTDGGTCYLMICPFVKLKYHTHSSREKSNIERTMECAK